MQIIWLRDLLFKNRTYAPICHGFTKCTSYQCVKFNLRTSHLTGLFTDLGIELSQLFFYRTKNELQKLFRSIKLRMIIIIFFFSGCILGGFTFNSYGIKSLLMPLYA
ncbi:DUF1275 family protein [Daejeonella sp.]|uniref:DUF1275 family protein n=1 Tax=Daejeonella sp. TaxID=2805397 RepID=UPI003782F79E